MVKNFERMAALGALGVCGGVVVTYLALAWLATTTPVAAAPGATGGIDGITRNVIWIAALVPALIFILSHLAFAKQLKAGPSSLND
jgi:hypothetical protein